MTRLLSISFGIDIKSQVCYSLTGRKIMTDKKAFKEIYSILKGEKQLEPLFLELKEYIESEFGIKVYDIVFAPIKKNRFYQHLKNGKLYTFICYVSSEDREKMQKRITYKDIPNAFSMKHDENKQNKIIDKMYEVNSKYNMELPTNKDQIWVDYFPWFESDYSHYVLRKIQRKLVKEVLHEYKEKGNIWRVFTQHGGLFIFYPTDNDLNINQENGITNEIKEFALSKIATVDDLKLYTAKHIKFDSKENLDKNYGGNWFYYFK